MKSTWFTDRRHYDFARCIADADYSRNMWDLFADWLFVTAESFAQSNHVLMTGAKCEAREKEVTQKLERLRKPEKFSEALADMVVTIEETNSDFLGNVYQECSLNDKSFKGQCFTPPALCKLMAELTIGERTPELGRQLTIDEPACGAGAMIIEVAKVLKGLEFYPWNYHIWANDVDWRCFAMTFIQTTLLGIPCIVSHSNTLTLEHWKTYHSFAAVMHPFRGERAAPVEPSEIDADEPAEIQSKPAQLKPTTPVIDLGDAIEQLSLFEI